MRELEAVLDAGPASSGWDEDQRWTLARIAELIWQRFGVGYTLAGVAVLLRRIGWSVQVPARQAAERDEARIAAWREETWPVVKGPRRTWAPGRHMIYLAAAPIRSTRGWHAASGHEKVRVCGQLAPGSRPLFLQSCGH